LSLLDGLKDIVFNNYDILKVEEEKFEGLNIDLSLKAKTVYDFDKYITAPINNYKSPKELYHKNSSKYHIKNIKVPTLFVHSLDDPICIKECIPYDEINKNKNCMIILT